MKEEKEGHPAGGEHISYAIPVSKALGDLHEAPSVAAAAAAVSLDHPLHLNRARTARNSLGFSWTCMLSSCSYASALILLTRGNCSLAVVGGAPAYVSVHYSRDMACINIRSLERGSRDGSSLCAEKTHISLMHYCFTSFFRSLIFLGIGVEKRALERYTE